ncbi:MAG: DUF2065 domain-containing protein [Gammaproteobacteria bacterium]
MEWNDLLAAFALYLVLEGVLPFISPRGWKQAITQMTQLSDQQMRMFGLISMVAGLLLLAFVRG